MRAQLFDPGSSDRADLVTLLPVDGLLDGTDK